MSTRLDSSPKESVVADFDVDRLRLDFPALHQEVYGHPLVYLDNAASAHKPKAMLEALTEAYYQDYSNVHRGVHALSQRATLAYEAAREKGRDFLGAGSEKEIVFVRGTTEAINLVAWSYVRPQLERGDEILISALEHHSNIVPWQMICEDAGARLRVIPIDDRGVLDQEAFEELLTERTRILAITHISNALGTINPLREMITKAKERGIATLVDGAQAGPHLPIDVQDLGCDFYTLSGHKVFGPTGIGLLYGRYELLENMRPYQGGGEMILTVTFDRTEYNVPPNRFEAGTPNIAGAIALGATFDYLGSLDSAAVKRHEDALLERATERLSGLPGIRLVGTAPERAPVVSFLVEGVHAHDVGTILDREGVAVRVGHHCAQPIMDHFGLPSTVRASFAFYNTLQEVDRLVDSLQMVVEIFNP